MRTLGYVTAITMAAAGTALGIVAVRSLPELRRYVAMRPVGARPNDVVAAMTSF